MVNNVGGISEALQQRVIQAAAELGFALEPVRPKLKLRHVSLFTMLAQPTIDPFYAGVLSGVEAECRRHGLHLSYAVVEPGPSSSAMVFDKVKQNNIDGLILLAVDDRALAEHVLAQGLTCVLINAEHPGLPLDTMLPDNEGGVRQAVQYLLDRGHRRILHLTSTDRPTIRRRLRHYRMALEENDVPPDPALVVNMPMFPEGAYTAMQAFLTANPPDFTAIFCVNDNMAIGVMRALQEAGRRIPQDVSIVGFDDVPMAAFLSPPLTTVRIEREELGALAVRRLIDRAAMPNQTAFRLELATRLIERQSVAAIRS